MKRYETAAASIAGPDSVRPVPSPRKLSSLRAQSDSTAASAAVKAPGMEKPRWGANATRGEEPPPELTDAVPETPVLALAPLAWIPRGRGIPPAPLCGLGLRLMPTDDRGLGDARGLLLLGRPAAIPREPLRPLRPPPPPPLLPAPPEVLPDSDSDRVVGRVWRPREAYDVIEAPLLRGDPSGDSSSLFTDGELLRDLCRVTRGFPRELEKPALLPAAVAGGGVPPLDFPVVVICRCDWLDDPTAEPGIFLVLGAAGSEDRRGDGSGIGDCPLMRRLVLEPAERPPLTPTPPEPLLPPDVFPEAKFATFPMAVAAAAFPNAEAVEAEPEEVRLIDKRDEPCRDERKLLPVP